MWETGLSVATRHRTALAIFGLALALRVLFAVLTAGTYDADEFVILALSRAVSAGATPYRDFMFFHPPGMLVLFGLLHPLLHWWWPFGRFLTMVFDSLTAVLVWQIGKRVYGGREALTAGLLYAVSPLALVSAVRVGPDPVITVLGVAGLACLLRTGSRKGAILAGICLGIAAWTKYPALLYLPVYVLAAPRRIRYVLLAVALTLGGLFAPLLGQAHALYDQTVVWQLTHRDHADFVHRFGSVGGYWLLMNPLATIAVWRVRAPRWLRVGFCLGAVFLLTSQAYYHYFVPIVPFAALLAAPLVTPIVRRVPRLVIAFTVGFTGLWALDVAHGSLSQHFFVSASSFSSVQETAAILDRTTPSSTPVLADEFEYALFAHRPFADNYFWNMDALVSAQSLEHRLPYVAAVVMTKGGRAYPAGFADYLEDNRYPQIDTSGTVVWLIHARGRSRGVIR